MRTLILHILGLSFCFSAGAVEDTNWDYDVIVRNFRQTLEKMVEANPTNPPGNEARVVAIAKARLDSAKIPYEITEFAPGRQNIVARLKGNGQKKPVLFLAHIDVVGAENQAWTVQPHKLTEKDGYLYGRGVLDDLGSAAIFLETFIALKKSGLVLNRDFILALTGDEESGGAGVRFVLKNKRQSIDAVYAFNEGGGLELEPSGEKVKMLNLQVAEKTYRDYELIAKGTTGHSSVPQSDNAIYKLARALAKLEKSPRPPKLIPVTRAYYEARSKVEMEPVKSAMLTLAKSKGALPKKALAILEKNPVDAANLRTTCVATILSGGTRVNALPSEAKANVNCRIMPDESTEEIGAYLRKVIADPSIEVKEIVEGGTAPASTLDGEAVAAIRKVTESMYPGLPIVPNMSRGATDSRYLRSEGIPSYGIDPIAITQADGTRAHGIDERIAIKSLRPGVEYLHKLILEVNH